MFISHRSLTILHQRQTCPFRRVYSFKSLEEAEGLLEVEVGTAYVGVALSWIIAADYVGVAAIEQPEAVESLSLFQRGIQYFELLEGLLQVSFGCFPVVEFQVHTATRTQRNSVKLA